MQLFFLLISKKVASLRDAAKVAALVPRALPLATGLLPLTGLLKEEV